MRVSKSFLNDYVAIKDIPMSEIANKMVLVGNEYESVEPISTATNLVVGEVISCINHPESDHLHVCNVNMGDETVQIVCGAPNCHTGIKVIVAKVGAKLPGGIEIKKAHLAGYDSNGMLCALEEIGIESKYVSDEEKNGIHILPSDTPIGINALEYLGYDDEVIDFELTANRSDLLSILGMAHEVGAIYKKNVKYPSIDYHENSENINDNYTLEVKTNNCPAYLGKLVKNVTIKESPMFIKTRLMASGIRPINNVVDISNYVMLECGQPLHFFDADKLGHRVIVRMANSDEQLVTLDGTTRTLKETDMVIANESGAVALAGVMGGLSTEITNTTHNIFIESAQFDSYHIRQTAKDILRSEASSRFEKGIDPNRTVFALKRAVYLLEQYAGGTVVGGMLNEDTLNKNAKVINITLDKIISVLGMTVTESDVMEVLTSLGFKCEVNNKAFVVTVPTRRLDINIKEDIIEEVGRMIGYDHLQSKLPITAIKKGTISKHQHYVKDIKTRLQSLGLTEVITYSLISKENIYKFTNKDFEVIKLLNPMSEERTYMRYSLIPSLLEMWEYNISRNIKDINVYEVGKRYSKADNNYVEETMINGLLYGNYLNNSWQNKRINVDFYVVKGIIENLLNYLGLTNRYSFTTNEILSDLHPGRSCNILVDNENIGYIGQVHPLINKKEIYIFELNLDKLFNKKVRSIKYKEINKYPSVRKDLAFIVKRNIVSEQLVSIIKKTAGRLLTNIELFDVYTGENVKADEKSLAYSLTFEDKDKTLNDTEVNNVIDKIIKSLKDNLGAELRDK